MTADDVLPPTALFCVEPGGPGGTWRELRGLPMFALQVNLRVAYAWRLGSRPPDDVFTAPTPTGDCYFTASRLTRRMTGCCGVAPTWDVAGFFGRNSSVSVFGRRDTE